MWRSRGGARDAGLGAAIGASGWPPELLPCRAVTDAETLSGWLAAVVLPEDHPGHGPLRAARRAPSADSLCELGVTLMSHGPASLGQAAFRHATLLDPASARAHGNLGSALKAAGDLVAA